MILTNWHSVSSGDISLFETRPLPVLHSIKNVHIVTLITFENTLDIWVIKTSLNCII